MLDLGFSKGLGRWLSRRFMFFCLVSFTVAIALVALPAVLGNEQTRYTSSWLSIGPEQAIAQVVNRREVSRRVYELLPELPHENHYVHVETGEVDQNNTLVYRLLQYHYDVQRRPLRSRFDWKLTLADYLGANEWITPDVYPDRRLESNPYERDLAVIQSLNRQQRESLILALLLAIAGR